MEKIVCLVSGGIDSPAAAFLLLKQGFEVIPVYFDNTPFAEPKNLVCFKNVVSALAKSAGQRLRCFIVPHGSDIVEILKVSNERNVCLHSKRHMHRVSEAIAKKLGASAIATGDTLASKASQTPQNLLVVDEAVSTLVLRPLIGLTKTEVERIARRAETMAFAKDHPQCVISSGKPTTAAWLEEVHAAENKLELGKMVERAVANASEFSV